MSAFENFKKNLAKTERVKGYLIILLFLFPILLFARDEGICDESEKEISTVLEKETKTVIWEEPWCLTYEDIDNDGEKEFVLGVVKYNCNLWSTCIGVDLKWLTEMPLSAVLSLKNYKFEQGQLKFRREIEIEKDADYIPPTKLGIKSFKIGDFNKDGLKEIFFVWDNGMKFKAKIIQIKGKKLRTLYSGPGDREDVEIKDIDNDGKLEVVERGLTWHMATEEEINSILKGHLFAIRIHKWDAKKGKLLPWKIIPDREVERKLTRKEVLEGIGAVEILKGVPQSKLKEIYPSAFK